MSSADLREKQLPVPKKRLVGVSRIWVHEDFRRKGVATRMAEAMRVRFRFPAAPAPKKELAFSHTTEAGSAFVERYLGAKEFLVYKAA